MKMIRKQIHDVTSKGEERVYLALASLAIVSNPVGITLNGLLKRAEFDFASSLVRAINKLVDRGLIIKNSLGQRKKGMTYTVNLGYEVEIVEITHRSGVKYKKRMWIKKI
jgi:hypothetical protein